MGFLTTMVVPASSLKLSNMVRFKARRMAELEEGDSFSFLPDTFLALERFRAKWTPVRVKKTRQDKNLELRF
ncbi:hypothetical protein CWO89_11015 [Bradyrhizobium sp. Leo170]|nr:hypothetical protein CWO89_11015 [Bradyrhizobium sp. Leo170]